MKHFNGTLELFKGLKQKDLDAIKGMFKEVSFSKHNLIFKPTDKGRVFIVKEGRIELYRKARNDQKFIIDVLKRNGIFGDLNLSKTSEIFAESMENSMCYVCATKDFFSLLAYPALAEKLFAYVFKRLVTIEDKLTSLATEDVLRRFLRLIIYLEKTSELQSIQSSMTDKYTHEQLSQMLGVSRQTITMLINELEDKGVIQRKKKKFAYQKNKLREYLSR